VIAAIGLVTTTRRATATAARVADHFPADPLTAPISAPRVRGGAQA
jgi:hypothetical protein